MTDSPLTGGGGGTRISAADLTRGAVVAVYDQNCPVLESDGVMGETRTDHGPGPAELSGRRIENLGGEFLVPGSNGGTACPVMITRPSLISVACSFNRATAIDPAGVKVPVEGS